MTEAERALLLTVARTMRDWQREAGDASDARDISRAIKAVQPDPVTRPGKSGQHTTQSP